MKLIATLTLLTLSLFLAPVALTLDEASGQMRPRRGRSKRRSRRRRKKKRTKKKKQVWNKTPLLMKHIKVIKEPIKGQDAQCVARLRAYGVKFKLLKNVKGVHTPVRLLTTKLGGVHFRRAWNNKTAPWILNCKMVENLILAGKHLRARGIASLYWTSAWRYSFVHGTKKLSNHAGGNALDITAIDGGFGYATLVSHWSNACKGCGRGCSSKKARALRAFICAMKSKKLFRTVYTPAYDALHRDHYHVDGPNAALKLKVKLPAAGAALSVAKAKSGAGRRKRSHWSKYPHKRKWEPPRSRPYRW